ncbi:MAG: response regulator [Lachnospiraceae bacterium]
MYRVVLVDDEQIILQGLQRAFPWAEYDCEVAGVAMDGQEGLKLIREVKPDLLLTDICMPNMDGLTMIAALKSAFPAMQVAVLTAYRDFDYAQKALNLGVCRYLLKPSNMEQLREAISTMKARLDEAPLRLPLWSQRPNPPKAPAKRALSSPGRPWTTSASTTPST